jgi:uncharacterized protein (DUF305 family)
MIPNRDADGDTPKAPDMARILLKFGRDEKLKRLAQSIIVQRHWISQ